ncbi:MAG: hypothetical protein JO125_11930 [Chloroflexi bacterium]|nr:hypothetical protein [Chloroflexota bacterium]
MISNSDIVHEEVSSELYQEILTGLWEQLADIKQSLEQGCGGDLSTDFTPALTMRVHEVTNTIQTVPEYLVPTFLVSKDALLEYLHGAIIELQLLRDQLGTGRKTRYFYKRLLACQRCIEKALEQKRNIAITWQEPPSQLPLLARHSLRAYIPGTSLDQGRFYQTELRTALEVLHTISRLFERELNIWQDQCTRVLIFLHGVQELTRELCDFLDMLISSPAATSPSYCQLVITIHHIHKQVSHLTVPMTRYRALCRSSSTRSANARVAISSSLGSLLREVVDGLQGLTMFLDEAYFQERRASNQSDKVAEGIIV